MSPDESFEAYQSRLLEAGVLVATGVEGLYGRSRPYEAVAQAVMRRVDAWAEQVGAVVLDFPPVVARQTFERTNYIESFPNLIGAISVFTGGNREHAELLRRLTSDKEWPELLEPIDVMLASAACHPVYPLCTGRLPDEGRYFRVLGHCFRHEPSADPTRMQSFRMQEVVFVGEPARALAHRDEGLALGLAMLEELGLDMQAVPANDPFFGRAGTMLATGQLDKALKIEGVTPICSTEHPTAIMSGNYHEDHFGTPFSIETAAGEVSHSACVAFGIERITLALFHRHGLDPAAWPAAVRTALAA